MGKIRFLRVVNSMIVIIDKNGILRIYDLDLNADQLSDESRCIIRYHIHEEKCRNVSVNGDRILITFERSFILIIDRHLRVFNHTLNGPRGYFLGDYILMTDRYNDLTEIYDLTGKKLYTFTCGYIIINNYGDNIIAEDISRRETSVGCLYMDNGELKMRDLNINTNGESMLSVNGQYLILTRKGHHQVYNLKTNELLCNFPHKDILSLLHCNEIIYFNGVMFINERNIQGRRMYVLYNLS